MSTVATVKPTSYGFIQNSSAAQDIAFNNNVLTNLLAQPVTDITIDQDVYVSLPIKIVKSKPVRIRGISPDSRLISQFDGYPIEIHSTYPGDRNPPNCYFRIKDITIIHNPPNNNFTTIIYGDQTGGANLGKYLEIENVTVSHFAPLIQDAKYKDIYAVDLSDSAGLNIRNLYCVNLNIGGLHIKNGNTVRLANYKGRQIANGRSLHLEDCGDVSGDAYCESFFNPPLLESVKWSQQGIKFWCEQGNWPNASAGYLLEVYNSQMSLYGQYGQDSNCYLTDNYTQMQSNFEDQINPYGNLISSQLAGINNNWQTGPLGCTVVNNLLTAYAFNDAGGQKLRFQYPTTLPQLNFKPGDIFFVTGNFALDQNTYNFYNQKLASKVDLPMWRVNMNNTTLQQNVYTNGLNGTFKASGVVNSPGTSTSPNINPDVYFLIYGDKTNQIPANNPLKIQFSNVSLWYVPSPQ